MIKGKNDKWFQVMNTNEYQRENKIENSCQC